MTISEAIEKLVGLRKGQSLSQSDVAKRMGTSQPRVSDVERLAGYVKITTIMRYANALGMDVRFKVTDGPDV